MRFLASVALPPPAPAAAHLRDRCDWRQATYAHTGTAVAFIISGDRCDWRQATYAHTGTAVAFIISELPESVPKPSSLQWQRWCPRRASIIRFDTWQSIKGRPS
jgi:hypothetical protein